MAANASRLLLAALVGIVLVTAPVAARASGLIADLSHHLIAITTAFSGTDVLLFGAIEEEGSEVVVVVRGPETPTTVRRKSRVGFVWLNTEEVTFRSVPAYYNVATSQPLETIASDSELRRYQIGIDNIELIPVDGEALDAQTLEAFREALIRNKQRKELYPAATQSIGFLGEQLFRTTLSFPANVPPGSYQVEVFQLRDGFVLGAQSSVLVISKVGMEAELFQFAQNRAALYGLASILVAVAAGWSAALIFRRS